MLLISLILLFAYGGMTVDFKNKKVRKYTNIFGLRYGKWEPLPGFDRITLTNKEKTYEAHNLFIFRSRITDQPIVRYVKNRTALNIRCRKRRLTIQIGNYRDLKKLGISISTYTGVDLYDFTGGKSKIIRKSISPNTLPPAG